MNEFKVCPSCHKSWQTRNNLIDDQNIEIVGYQANLKDIDKGFFIFTHTGECGTSFAVENHKFRDIYTGPDYEELQKGSEECEGHCLDIGNLGICHAKCSSAIYREIMAIIANRRYLDSVKV